MKNEKYCSELNACFKRRMAFRKADESLIQRKTSQVSSSLQYYVQKQLKLLSLLSMNKRIILLQF
jgi:hypothetical protein